MLLHGFCFSFCLLVPALSSYPNLPQWWRVLKCNKTFSPWVAFGHSALSEQQKPQLRLFTNGLIIFLVHIYANVYISFIINIIFSTMALHRLIFNTLFKGNKAIKNYWIDHIWECTSSLLGYLKSSILVWNGCKWYCRVGGLTNIHLLFHSSVVWKFKINIEQV